MISEDKIVQVLQVASPGGFIGDDTAILPHATADNRNVITKDLFMEDVHFRTRYFTPRDIAHKVLHVNLSDIAAMGAEPSYMFILCGISIPNKSRDYAISFLNSLALACQKAGYDLMVIGYITDRDGISFKQGNQNIDLDINPFTHFGERL